MQALELISTFLTPILIVAALVWFEHSRAEVILKQWASESSLSLVSAEKRYMRTGPFFMNHYRGQFVFRVVVRYSNGKERGGWICVGGALGGVLSNKTKVIWD